jgi:hypothetical protein
MRYRLSEFEWTAIRPMLPNKPRGVPRVNDRRVLNGIFWVLRSGAPWRDLPENYRPYGIVLLAVARDISAKLRYVPTMALLFFVGRVGRGLSYMSVGAPHPVFTALMVVELPQPPLFVALLRGVRP